MLENIENTREIEERQNYILNHERESELEKDYDECYENLKREIEEIKAIMEEKYRKKE